MQGLLKIENDIFGIAERIKRIDESYAIYYNNLKKRFEVYSKKGFELVLPFSQLDSRTINHLWATHIKNIEKALREIDESNAKLENLNNAYLAEMTAYKTKNLVSFLDKGGLTLPSFEEI